MRVRARCEVATDGRGAAPYYWNQTMSAGMHESHHQSRSKITGHGGREKKRVLVFRESRGNEWTDEGMERGMSTLIVHIRSSLHLRLANTRQRHLGRPFL